MNVLIADDDGASRRILEHYLSQWGYELTMTASGDEALEILSRPDHPQLVILDWMLPGIDGPDIIRKVRNGEKSTAIYFIMLTARRKRDDIIHALESGADDYISKPFDRGELRSRIQVGERVVRLQADLERRVGELEKASTQINTLHGLLPICAHCHKIRDDQDVWQRLESYITEHTKAMLSHSVCPECLEEHYPDLASEIMSEDESI